MVVEERHSPMVSRNSRGEGLSACLYCIACETMIDTSPDECKAVVAQSTVILYYCNRSAVISHPWYCCRCYHYNNVITCDVCVMIQCTT